MAFASGRAKLHEKAGWSRFHAALNSVNGHGGGVMPIRFGFPTLVIAFLFSSIYGANAQIDDVRSEIERSQALIDSKDYSGAFAILTRVSPQSPRARATTQNLSREQVRRSKVNRA
jgi:hypothetical protein